MHASSPLVARVEVWRVELAGLPPPTEEALAVLDGEERRRHASYLAPEPARIFATTRIALRRLIGARTGRPPGAVRLARDGHGKPFAPDRPGLSFNVSHCSSEALIAFCDAGAVGIDIEGPSAAAPPESFGPLVCSDAELRWLRAHPDAADAALERLWCRKEAVSKAWGIGLNGPMSRIDTVDPGSTQGSLDGGGTPRTVWRDLGLPSGHVAAVAVTSPTIRSIDVLVRPFADLRPVSSPTIPGTPGRHFHRPGREGVVRAGRT